jgi:hypothetical protein
MSRSDFRTHVSPAAVTTGLLAGFGLLLVFHLKQFTLWSQIAVLAGVNPLALFTIHHTHALRYLVLSPMIEVALACGWDLSLTFSWVALGLFYLMSYILGQTLRILWPDPRKQRWYTVYFLALWLFIALFMNGRLVFAFLGVSFILFSQIAILAGWRMHYRLTALQVLGLLLSSVSTGTYTVALLTTETFLFTLPLMQLLCRKTISYDIASMALIILLIAVPSVQQAVTKNLDYFSLHPQTALASQDRIHNIQEGADRMDTAHGKATHLPTRSRLKTPSDINDDTDDKPMPTAEIDNRCKDAGGQLSWLMREVCDRSHTLSMMLVHGPAMSLIERGIRLEQLALIVPLFVIGVCAATGISYCYALRSARIGSPLILLFGYASMLGIFGYSVCLMMLPGVVLVTANRVIQWLSHNAVGEDVDIARSS